MSVVRINAITVPAERAEEFEGRFAARAGEVAKSPGFEAFERLLEIVSDDPEDKQAARQRWRAYQGAGHTPHSHDLSRQSAGG